MTAGGGSDQTILHQDQFCRPLESPFQVNHDNSVFIVLLLYFCFPTSHNLIDWHFSSYMNIPGERCSQLDSYANWTNYFMWLSL